MYIKLLLSFVLLFATGCTSNFKKFHIGAGSTGKIGRLVQPAGQSLSYGELSYKHGHTLDLGRGVALDGLYGPRLGFPLTNEEEGVILGVETEARVRAEGGVLEPYIGLHLGTATFTNKWPDQRTKWGFTLGPLLGVKYNEFFIEYKFWHESNGSNVFGHNRKPNPGYNISMMVIGIEW